MNARTDYYPLLKRIEAYAPGLGGVFSAADLANLLGRRTPLARARILARLVRDGVLIRVQRGIYTTPSCDLWRLTMRIAPASYISMDAALAHWGLVGTVPERGVTAVHIGRPRTIATPCGTIRLSSISRNLFFGFVTIDHGVRIADAEKAFLDLLFFYTKGARFVVDPRQEVAVRKLNRRRLADYLKRYRNPRFVAFVKGLIREEP